MSGLPTNPLKDLPDSEVFKIDYENATPESLELVKERLAKISAKGRAVREERSKEAAPSNSEILEE